MTADYMFRLRRLAYKLEQNEDYAKKLGIEVNYVDDINKAGIVVEDKES